MQPEILFLNTKNSHTFTINHEIQRVSLRNSVISNSICNQKKNRETSLLYFFSPGIFHFCRNKCWPLFLVSHFHTEEATWIFILELHFSGFQGSIGNPYEKWDLGLGGFRGRCEVRWGLSKPHLDNRHFVRAASSAEQNEKSIRQTRLVW